MRPFFSTSVSSFNDAPDGRFSPRSRLLTRLAVTFRWFGTQSGSPHALLESLGSHRLDNPGKY